MGVSDSWEDVVGYFCLALGLPAIIFLRPDNLTSRLDPRVLVVLREWISKEIRKEK